MQDHNTETPEPINSPRWMRWALVVSLAVNLLILGFVAGWMLKGGPDTRHGPARVVALGGPLTQALAPEDRRAIGREMRRSLRSNGETRYTQRALRRDLLAELRRTPFDAAAVEAVLATHRNMMGQRMSLGQSLLVGHLAKMTPEARVAYADRLEQVLKKRRGKKKD